MATRCCWPPESWSGIGIVLVPPCRRVRALRVASRSHSACGRFLILTGAIVTLRSTVHVLEQVVLLEHDRHAVASSAQARARARNSRSCCRRWNLAAGRRSQADQYAQQRALARARRADEADDLAVVDATAYFLQHLLGAVGGRQVLDSQDEARRFSRYAARRPADRKARNSAIRIAPKPRTGEKPRFTSILPANVSSTTPDLRRERRVLDEHDDERERGREDDLPCLRQDHHEAACAETPKFSVRASICWRGTDSSPARIISDRKAVDSRQTETQLRCRTASARA